MIDNPITSNNPIFEHISLAGKNSKSHKKHQNQTSGGKTLMLGSTPSGIFFENIINDARFYLSGEKEGRKKYNKFEGLWRSKLKDVFAVFDNQVLNKDVIYQHQSIGFLLLMITNAHKMFRNIKYKHKSPTLKKIDESIAKTSFVTWFNLKGEHGSLSPESQQYLREALKKLCCGEDTCKKLVIKLNKLYSIVKMKFQEKVITFYTWINYN